MKEILKIRGLKKRYDRSMAFAVNDISLTLVEHEVCAVVGQSGCGKSTLLKLISGLEEQDEGEVYINGIIASSEKLFVEAEKRGVGYVFQYFALFPHMTIGQNIAFGIKTKNKKTRVDTLLNLVGLNGYAQKYPHELSGGEQQRVALARALAPEPSLILLDEPFSNLDVSLKQQLRDDLFDIIKNTGVSCLFVTHDIADAMTVADKIVVMKKGHIIQEGKPRDLYLKPNDIYIANMFGEVNELSAADLRSFGRSFSSTAQYALRLTDFKLREERNNETAQALVLARKYLGRETCYTMALDTGKHIKLLLPSTEEIKSEQCFLTFDNISLIVLS